MASLLATSVATSVAGAQGGAISGAVRPDARSGAPAASVVQLTDGDGRTLVAIRPSPSGAFAIRPLRPGTYRLRLLRLGFQPVERQVTFVGADIDLGTIDGPGTLIDLAPVRVRGSNECSDARAGGRVGDLWRLFEVALATQIADEARSAVAERWLSYEQRLDTRTGIVEEVTVRDAATSGGYRPAPASALADRGFVTPDGHGVVYFLPVAATLLSPEFLERYCFRADDSTATGSTARSIAFRALRSAEGRTDVAGAMRFSPDGRTIDQLQFDYVNLPGALARSKARGSVVFNALEERSSIAAWWVEMPVVEVDGSLVPSAARTMVRAPGRVVTTSLRRVGAIRLPNRPCATCAPGQAPLPPGLLVERNSTSDDSSAIVSLRLASAAVSAPQLGTAIPWPPGRYEVRLATAFMAAHEVEERSMINIADTPRPTRLTYGLTRAEVLRRACTRERAGSAAVGGTVTSRGGQGLGGVSVVIRSIVRGDETDRITATGPDGHWRLCLPPGERVVRAWALGDVDRSHASVAPTADESVIDLVVDARVDGGLTPPTPVDPAASAAPTILEIRVRSASGVPLEDVEVQVATSRRTPDRRRTDARGLALFLVSGTGEVRISARKVGIAPTNVVARIAAGRNAIGLLMSEDRVGQLDTVRVLGDRRVSSRLDAFESRARQRQPNMVLRAEQLNQYTRLADALIRVPGVVVIDSAGQQQARANRRSDLNTTSAPGMSGCKLRVVIDGVPQPPEAGLNSGPSATQLHGVEVYLSTARMPIEFAGTLGRGECGLLLVWTKDGR